jgi:hypothetical protein
MTSVSNMWLRCLVGPCCLGDLGTLEKLEHFLFSDRHNELVEVIEDGQKS